MKHSCISRLNMEIFPFQPQQNVNQIGNTLFVFQLPSLTMLQTENTQKFPQV